MHGVCLSVCAFGVQTLTTVRGVFFRGLLWQWLGITRASDPTHPCVVFEKKNVRAVLTLRYGSAGGTVSYAAPKQNCSSVSACEVQSHPCAWRQPARENGGIDISPLP